jgi:hypothetical protein
MNETRFHQALRAATEVGRPPLALDAAGMLNRARQARNRRRASLAVGSSVLAAAAVTAVALTLPGGAEPSAGPGAGLGASPGGGSGSGQPATPSGIGSTVPTSGPPCPTPSIAITPTVTVAPMPTCLPSGGDNTETPWPSGQTDRTAHSGPHAEQAQQLLADLRSALPAGYQPANPWAQAQFEDRVGQVEVWEYLGTLNVRRGGGTGTLLARVVSPAPGSSSDLCRLARYFQDAPAPACQVRTVNGKKVAIATAPPGGITGYSPALDKWAVYRAADGTVVWLGQARQAEGGRRLPAPVFTDQQLAELAASGRFTG